MAEAGPEAILPLHRTTSGDLGVQSTSAPVNVYVTTRTEKPMEVKQERRGRDIYITLQEQLAGDIARGSPISKAIESKYGLSRRT